MDAIQSAENVASLAATLDLARQLAGEVGGVPVEIVEASGQAGVLGETSHGGGQTVVTQDEALEIMSSSLTVPVVAPSSMASGMAQVGPLASTDMVQQLAAEGIAGTHAITLAGPPLPTADNNGGTITSTADLAARLGVSLDNNLEQQLQQVSQSAMQTFQEVSRSLRSEGIEISPEAIADSLAATITHSQAPSATSVLESAISHQQSSRGAGLMGMNYSDLADMTRVISSSADPQLSSREPDRAAATIGQSSMESVLNESEVIPSSPESNFDTSELLNTISHRDDLMSKLASTGPVGVAAAAAIVSSRKRKRHSFESNPALRKRHCSKLMRRLRETLDELSTRVGLQTCVVTYRPSAKSEKPDPVFKVFGTSPLIGTLENQKEQIMAAMDESLRKQAPPLSSLTPQPKQALFELPPLVFDGIPTPINEMTQAQLRAFIPGMLKFSTGRGKPGWGKSEMRPSWWPDDIPWQNVRSDVRSDEQKKNMSWTEALRKILTTCYIHHGRTDLLRQFTSTSQQQQQQHQHQHREEDNVSLTVEAEEQLRMTLQQQSHELDLAALQQHSVTGGREGGGVEDVDPSLVENHQVFTIDTGMGNCDTTGMPTLADASLAETAARLQQVADETGQVQYATQTVTVTDRDAKALGQPVGSTTTVLLTAYPSGHGPPAGSGPPATSSQQLFPPPSTSTTAQAASAATAVSTAAGVPSVQVVYSASHVSELPDSIMSGIGTTSVAQELYSQGDAVTSAVEAMDTTVTDSSDYLTSPQVMVAAAAHRNDPCSIADLASQYINQYAGSLEPPTADTSDQLTAAADPATGTQDI